MLPSTCCINLIGALQGLLERCHRAHQAVGDLIEGYFVELSGNAPDGVLNIVQTVGYRRKYRRIGAPVDFLGGNLRVHVHIHVFLARQQVAGLQLGPQSRAPPGCPSATGSRLRIRSLGRTVPLRARLTAPYPLRIQIHLDGVVQACPRLRHIPCPDS